MGANGSTQGTIEPLGRADLAEAAGVLARAFRDNPGLGSVLREDAAEVRERLILRCMMGFAESVLRYGVGEVVRTEGKIGAVSLSFRPDQYPPPFWAQVIQSKGPIRTSPAQIRRFIIIDAETRRRHPHHYRHWYLWFLGVDPALQGRGLGGQLLRSLSAKAEADGSACYLETDKATSVKIYERHGYAVQNEEVIGKLDLRLWFMKRDVPSAH